jgi:hypothetical protein
VKIQQMAPPGVSAELIASLETPVNRDRGFFYPNEQTKYETAMGGEVLIPLDRDGEPMSPIEAATGVVLPIIAPTRGSNWVDRHHAHFYKWVYTTGTLGEKALRASRLQRVDRKAHDTYHNTFRGTLIPETEADIFNTIILNLASYVPSYGVEINGRKSEIVPVSSQDRWALRSPTMFRPEMRFRGTIGKFLMTYAMEQEFSIGKMSLIDDFLSLTKEAIRQDKSLRAKKLRLGIKLTNTVLGNVVNPMNPEYTELRRKRALSANSPPSVFYVARNQIEGNEWQYVHVLDRKLRKQTAQASS